MNEEMSEEQRRILEAWRAMGAGVREEIEIWITRLMNRGIDREHAQQVVARVFKLGWVNALQVHGVEMVFDPADLLFQ